MEKKIFEKTDGIRGKFGEEPVNIKTFRGIARAVAAYLGGKGVILIGRDSRESGVELAKAVEEGLAKTGMDVWDLGVISTPALAYIVRCLEEVRGGIMITASHNPAADNGMKVFDENGDKFTDETELAVEQLYFDGVEFGDEPGEIIEKENLQEKYVRALNFECDKKLKICVDSASGGAWKLSRAVFSQLGAETLEISKKPDGRNINESGALHPESLAKEVLAASADLGVALDGDADRIILVDDMGRIWDGDRITTMLAEAFGVKKVVLTEYSNLGAVQYLEERGVAVEKVLVGDKEVAQRCKSLGLRLGGEAAGHVIDLDWLTSSDGLYVAICVLKQMQIAGKKMSELYPEYEMFPQKIWNIIVKEKRPLEEIGGWAEAFRAQSEYLGGEGRVFARYSGTEKKLRIMVESKNEGKMLKVGEVLSEIIEKELGA